MPWALLAPRRRALCGWTYACTRLAETVAPEAIIRTRALRKTYDTGRLKVDALCGVDLDVAPGEMVAVMGPSGCGKTTLLNCLSGLDDITEGQVLLEGKDLARMGDRARTRLRSRRMGFVFQSFNLLPVLTALENVELPLLVSGVDPKEAAKRAKAALERVGLAGLEGHKPKEMSGGQQQRVTIARSLVNNPAIVWADEPTGNLDSERSREVMGLLVDLNRRLGQTYVIVTHDASVASVCHRIIYMQDGRIVREQRPSRRGA